MSYDPTTTPDQIFIYNVYANGIGGFIKRNGQILTIPSVGGEALSAAGGRARTEAGRLDWAPSPYEPAPPEGFRISVDGVTTELWTEENDHEWVTNAEVRVYGFNLCERVKIGLMVNRLTSRHAKGRDRAALPDGGQPRISFEGSQYWSVSIDGEPVHITIDRDLDQQCTTHDSLKRALSGSTGATAFCPANLVAAGPPQYMRDLQDKYKSPKYTRCAIVGEVRHPKAHGYSVDLTDPSEPTNRSKNLGRVFFGEMLVGDEIKHLNMIRWDLGCETFGGGTGGAANMNGATMP